MSRVVLMVLLAVLGLSASVSAGERLFYQGFVRFADGRAFPEGVLTLRARYAHANNPIWRGSYRAGAGDREVAVDLVDPGSAYGASVKYRVTVVLDDAAGKPVADGTAEFPGESTTRFVVVLNPVVY